MERITRPMKSGGASPAASRAASARLSACVRTIGFSAKVGVPDSSARRQVLQVQVVRRADHHQVVGPGRQQRLRACEVAAHRDAEPLEDRRAHRRGVDLAGQLQRPAHLGHGPQHVGDPLAQADNPDPIGLHRPSQARPPGVRHLPPRRQALAASNRCGRHLFDDPDADLRPAGPDQCLGVSADGGRRLAGDHSAVRRAGAALRRRVRPQRRDPIGSYTGALAVTVNYN